MSLNGLDDAQVQAAHEAAIAEPGGWFLLKYASRDEVEIFDSGTGGITEIRNAIGTYKEPSPLYGFLRYRRRGVIIKYMPEDCSRLIQARATVHFNAICEEFTHDTVYEISEPKELGDRKLSAACSLHGATVSTSSTTSLRMRLLSEIAEEEEEEKAKQEQSEANEPPRPSSSVYSDSQMPSSEPSPAAPGCEQIADSYVRNLPEFSSSSMPLSPTKSESSRRLSSQSARLDVYSSSSFNQGRKVKLGPRPSQEIPKKSTNDENFRPVAALPAGFKLKGAKKGKHPELEQTSQQADAKGQTMAQEPDPIHSFAEAHLSTSKLNPADNTQPASKENKISPEKARLMKAMKLREKKIQEAKLEEARLEAARLEAARLEEVRLEEAKMEEAKLAEDQLDQVSLPVPVHQSYRHEPHGDNVAEEETASDETCEKPVPVRSDNTSDTDSAIDVPDSVTISPELQLDDAASETHPSSPDVASFTGVMGDSTMASSLSESAGDTIQMANQQEEQEHVADDVAVTSDAAEVSDMLEEASLPESALEPDAQEDNTAERFAHTSPTEPIITGIPITNSRKCAGELAQIPRNEPDISQNTGTMNKKSVENDDNTGDLGETLGDKKLAEDPVQQAVSGLHESGDPNSGGDKAKPNISGNRPSSDPGRDDENSVPPSSLGVPLSLSTISEEGPSPTSQVPSPTTAAPDLTSDFSRKDAAVSAASNNPATFEKTVISPALPEHEDSDSRRYAPSPEVQAVYPPQFSRQKIVASPIRTDIPTQAASKKKQAAASDFLDDDALMEELQTATVQEAKPITVSKSPITPVFPTPSTSPPPAKDTNLARVASNPLRSTHLTPTDGFHAPTSRSISMGGATAFSDLSRQPSNASTASKKGNVGSSISQRIKALEALSNQPADDRPRPTTPSATFFGVRKQPSKRESSRASSIRDRPASRMHNLSPNEDSLDPNADDALNPRRERSSSVVSRLSVLDVQRNGSVSGTASKNAGGSPTDYRQPTLLVDVQKANMNSHYSELSPMTERPMTGLSELYDPDILEKQARRRSSSSLMKNFFKENSSSLNSAEHFPGSSHRSPSRPPSSHSTFRRRLSGSSRQSSHHEGDHTSVVGASPRPSDAGFAAEDEQSGDKKSTSRTASFMRRLSNSLGAGRKASGASIAPPAKEENADQVEKEAESSQSAPAIVALMGDVNVQFPDNLLWKRRSMCLDAQGFLFLSSASGAAKKTKECVGTKRYHLGDFRKPYIPDVEIQELPNSVVLDFVEGSSLQIACGDRASQMEVLKTLQEAHQRHAL